MALELHQMGLTSVNLMLHGLSAGTFYQREIPSENRYTLICSTVKLFPEM